MKKYLALAAFAACVPGVAFAQDKDEPKLSGVRAEARIGYETPTVSGNGSIYKLGSAVSYGGEAGFDLRAKNITIGVYGIYEGSSVSLCDVGGCLKEKGNYAGGARLGFIAGRSVVIYAKAGYAHIDFKGTGTLSGLTGGKGGVQGALGLNVNVGKNVYVMTELNYADYGKMFGTNLQRRHAVAGVGFRF